jgi:hypothetical protein
MNEAITISRAILEALATNLNYIDNWDQCHHCHAPCTAFPLVDEGYDHAADCPVVLAQEALQQAPREDMAYVLLLCMERLMAFRGDLADFGIREDFNDSLIARCKAALGQTQKEAP